MLHAILGGLVDDLPHFGVGGPDAPRFESRLGALEKRGEVDFHRLLGGVLRVADRNDVDLADFA